MGMKRPNPKSPDPNAIPYPSFSDRLVLAMAVRDATNQKLAKDVFVSTSAISAYRCGYRQPNFEVLRGIALSLRVSTDYLLGLSDDPNPL